MFPINLKWIDDIYDKIESVCTQVDGIPSKEQESSKYDEGLNNVGNNVKQVCSTMDPLKYVEDQLQTFGTKIEQLCSSVVPSSIDTMLSAVNNIFPLKEPDSAACKHSELQDSKADNDDSMAEPVTSVEMNEDVVPVGKLENSKLDLEYTITQTVQCFDDNSSPIYDEFFTDEGPSAGFCSPGQTAEKELKEETNADDKITLPKKMQLDESCIVVNNNDLFIYGVPVDTKSPKVKLSSPSTSKLPLIHRRRQMKTKSKSSISEEPSIEKEQRARSLSPPTGPSNQDTWESDWEII